MTRRPMDRTQRHVPKADLAFAARARSTLARRPAVRRLVAGFARAGLAAALALALLAGVIAWQFAARREPANEPVAASEVVFTTIQGQRISLAELRGKVVLVDFWATSCAVCLNEMPEIAGIHRRLSARGLVTIAVAMPYDRPDFVLHYAARNALPFAVALDPQGRVTQALGPVRGTPTLILIDRAGRVVRRIEGESDLAALERLIERELGA